MNFKSIEFHYEIMASVNFIHSDFQYEITLTNVPYDSSYERGWTYRKILFIPHDLHTAAYRYPTLTCMPCASEISSYEPPHAAAVVRNPNFNCKVCVVHHAATLSSWNALDAYERRVGHGDRYPTLTCMPCASEISSYEPPHARCCSRAKP